MKTLGRLLLAVALTWLPLADASAAVVQITVKDAGGATRSFNVTTNTDLTGNLDWNNVICDQAAGTTCASVGTAGSPSTNALTVQAVTLGHGTAAAAMRVELPTDGTGQVNVANANANGQATMANSSPVVIASNQSAITVTGAAGTFPVTQSTSPWIVAGGGTAGSAATGVVTIQGIASMTKLLVTPDSVALPANQSVNTAQVNGVTTLTGTGATGTGAQRVTISTDQATNAGAALAKGGVGVVNGGSFYQTVAASATATVLQSSTGAIGDYLSHCVLYPTSTSPGVVTVFDNANAAATNVILFAGGSSSLSNLAPIAVPVGAVSTAGAWKVTTGASISVACYGKFS